MSITQRTISVSLPDGASLPCYLAVPVEGKGPGLLLLHDAAGLDDHQKHLANRYAEEGWVVAAPDLHANGAAPVSDERGFREAMAALKALRALPECSGKLGVMGHGPGARLAPLLAAATPELACAIAYYPDDLDACTKALGQATCPVVLHLVATADADLSLQGNPRVTIHRYEAAAGFDNPNEPAFDRSAHWLAKSRTLAVLRSTLGPVYDLAALWEAHLYSEFAERNVDVSMDTMVDDPYVFVLPTVTGGTGKPDLHRWYSNHFHFQNPEDTRIIPISRTVGTDRLVDEFIFCFTHDRVMDWILPGVAPTGRYVEVPMTAVVNFRGPKLYHEHIAWDQATVLVQTGLLDPTGLPVTGIEQSKAMQDERLPRNRLIPGW